MMFDKIKDKDYIMRLVAILLITSIGILSLTILSSNNDGRKQIIDRDGGEESKLCAALSNIKGVGKVDVSISVKGSYETVYATEKKTTKTESGEVIVESPIVVGGKTVIVTENYPKIIGLIVVAGGADNIAVNTNIMNTVVNFLEIDSKKVIILNGKK